MWPAARGGMPHAAPLPASVGYGGVFVGPPPVASVDEDCQAAISQLLAEGAYCSLGSVSARVCFLRSVPSVHALGVVPFAVPTLRRLFAIDQAIDNFVLGFAASRSVATLRDLEVEAVALLRRMLIPTAQSVGGSGPEHGSGALSAQTLSRVAKNPDEIALADDDEGDDEDSIGRAAAAAETESCTGTSDDPCAKRRFGDTSDGSERFADFGVGELTSHPVVRRIWQPPRGLNVAECPDFADIAPYVMEVVFQSMSPASTALHAPPTACDPDFTREHLCARLEVHDLADVGVILVDRALPSLFKAFRHTELRAYQLELRAQEVRMNQLNEVNIGSSRAEKRRRLQVASAAAPPVGSSAVLLKPSDSEPVAGVVEACRRRLGTTYSPTYTKVREVLKGLHAASRKDHRGDSLIPTKAAFLDVCTEYVMLHLGSSKWRCRRWEWGAESTAPKLHGTNEAGETEDKGDTTVLVEDVTRPDRQQPATRGPPQASLQKASAPPRVEVQTLAQSEAPAQLPSSPQVIETVGTAQPRPGAVATTSIPFARGSLSVGMALREGTFEGTWRVGSDMGVKRPTVRPDMLDAVAAVPWSGHLDVTVPLDATDSRSVGRWGEALVYAYLVATTPNAMVEWVNEEDETRAPYDIVVTDRSGTWSKTRYIEVKTTRYRERNVCELSAAEWAFASKEPRINYDLYRVENAGAPGGPTIYVVSDLQQQITERKARLCVAI